MTDELEPARQPIRASDAEREHSIVLLREAVGEGRLTLEEFSERVDLAQAARTDGDLAELTSDLPSQHVPSDALDATPERHRAFCSHLTRNGPWSLPRHSSWRSVFGTIDLDLRQARLDGPETLLEVYNLFGTVTLIVPEGVEVVVRGGGHVRQPEDRRTRAAGDRRCAATDDRHAAGRAARSTCAPGHHLKRSIRDVLTR